MTSPAMSQSPTSTWSPLLPPLLPHLPSPTPATLTPMAPTPTWPLVPTSLLPLPRLRWRLLPLLPLLPSPTPPTPMPMLDTLDTPTPLLPTTPAVSTTLAALCPAPKRPASKLRPKTDGGPQRTEDDWRTRTGYWRTLCRTNGLSWTLCQCTGLRQLKFTQSP